MIWKRDDCTSIEALIHLSIDGKLDDEGRRRLEKHLAACPRCAEKLERLRAIEAGSRSIGLEEPPPEYWSTFSRRVIEKIEAGPGGRPVWNPARAFAGLFAVPRMRLAAAIASLAIVVLVGALYVHYREGIVPSMPVRGKVETVSRDTRMAEPEVKSAVEPKLGTTVQPKSEQAVESKVGTEAQATSKQAVEPKVETGVQPKSEPLAESKAGQKREALQADKERAPEVATKAPEEPSAAKKLVSVAAGPEKPVAAGPARTVAAESVATSHIEPSAVRVAELNQTDTLGPARPPSVAEKSKEQAAMADATKRTTETQPASRMVRAFSEKKGERTAMLFNRDAASTARGESFVLDGATVPRVSAADTLLSEDALRNVIYEWRSHIERHPLDPRNREGYVQVANAYYLLARLTRDEAIISQGTRLVQEYADRADDPGLKTLLLDSKARIESLRGK